MKIKKYLDPLPSKKLAIYAYAGTTLVWNKLLSEHDFI